MAIKTFAPPPDFIYEWLTCSYYRMYYSYDPTGAPVLVLDRFDHLKGTYEQSVFPVNPATGQVPEEMKGALPHQWPPFIRNMMHYPSPMVKMGTLAAAGISLVLSLIILAALL